MKKLLSLLLCFILFFCTSYANNNDIIESNSVNIVINSEKVNLTSPVIFSNSHILFPLKNLSSLLNIPIENIVWNQKTQSITLLNNGQTLIIRIGHEEGILNNTNFDLPSSPILYKSQTYVPIRLFSEFLNCYILWDSSSRSVFIKDIENYFQTTELIQSINTSVSNAKYAKIDTITELKSSNNSFSFGTSVYLDLEKNKIYEKSILDKEWKLSKTELTSNPSAFSEQFSKIFPCAVSVDKKLSDENQIVLSGFYPLENNLLCQGKIYIDAKTLEPIKLISETETSKKSTIYTFNIGDFSNFA